MKISFVIPSKDSIAWLPHAIESVSNQTYDDIELVIVNDGSTDTTKMFLNKFTDEKTHAVAFETMKERFKNNIKIIHTEGVGRSKARNIGNSAATGEIIFVLDADDYADPNRVKKTLVKFKDGVQFVYGSAIMMDFSGTKGDIISADVINKEKILSELHNRIVHSSVAYTKEFAMLYPYLEQPTEISEYGIDDWEQQIRAILNGVKMDFVPTVVVAYRQLGSSISQTRDANKVKEFKKKYLEAARV